MVLEPTARLREIAVRMSDSLQHRGPDGGRVWEDARAGVAFGHRRLAIVDLSEGGAQPMTSASGRFTITYNGEIYNFRELRSELQALGHSFHGGSDTEVMLAAIEQWGLEAAVKRCAGMFACAVWDAREQVISLIRDRLGKKPLYYSVNTRGLYFASELKALVAAGINLGNVSSVSVSKFLRYGCIPAEHTIYSNVSKLLPGHILHVARTPSALSWRRVCYWTPDDFRVDPAQTSLSEADVLRDTEQLVTTAVRERMISDVPLGAFLSGGIDSSLVVALMQEIGGSPVSTFCIGFEDKNHDESAHAAAVAKHIGTRHHTMILDAKRGLELAQRMASYYDEPFADVSQIPTVAVSHFARQELTVSLSGDGGDELFAGYTRYGRASHAWSVLGKMPMPVRRGIARGIVALRPHVWDKIARPVELALPKLRAPTSPGDRLHKLASVLCSASSAELYDHMMSHWGKNDATTQAWASSLDQPSWRPAYRGDLLDMMMRQDLVAYLPDDILTKVDRASMSASLEARCPLLDHRLVEYALRLPLQFKIREGQSKWPLRQLLYRRVPRELVDRPKTGFGVPLAEWLRGPWREWAESLLNPAAIEQWGVLEPRVVQRFWREHLSGARSWHYYLWDLLMLQSWLELGRSRQLAA
jgi:asparagine synthase (glutamine-hydrolysing)